MFTKTYFAVTFGAALFVTSPASFASPATDAVAAFHAALAAGEKSKVTELMAPEVVIYESGYVEGSFAEYAAHHLGEDMAFAKTSDRKVIRQSERTVGNIAIVSEETETTGTSHGKALHVFGTETAVLEKRDDIWRIVHVHWSSRKAK
jgi:ketosteroid isomerase-like protein